MSEADTKLTDKQRLFVEHYLQCWNATEAARRAGYKDPEQSGWMNKKKVEIQQEISQRMSQAAMGADEVLARLADQARADMRDFLLTDDEGKPTGFNLGPDRPLHLVKRVSITDKGISFEIHDAHAALVDIGKAHGLFVDRQEVNHSGELALKGYVNVSPDDWDKDAEPSGS